MFRFSIIQAVGFLAFLLGANAFSDLGRPTRDRTTRTSSKAVPQTLEPGQILLPSTNDPTKFDAACAVHPVVLPPCDAYNKWQLYYYGNSNGKWADGTRGFLPTGWCGLAESEDGIHWTKIKGSLEGGSILAPASDDPDAWDAVHVGVGDVIRISDDELQMYYFGGSQEMVEGLMGGGGPSFSGIRMRIGRAKSTDNGRTWERLGVCLDCDPSEGLFASWPRIIKPDDSSEPWQMIYHAFNGSQYCNRRTDVE